MRAGTRVVWLLLAAIAGVVVAVVGCVIAPASVGGLPVGLAVAVLLCFCTGALAGLVAHVRTGPLMVALGWMVGIVVASLPHAAGDLLVPATGTEYTWLLLGVVALVAALRPTYRPAGPDQGGGAERR